MSVAAIAARRVLQEQRVRVLYRRALRNVLSYAVHRDIFYIEAQKMREQFEKNKDVATLGLMDSGGASEAASDVTDKEAGTSNVEVVDDSAFYQQLLVDFLESSNLGGLGGIQRRQHTKKRKVVDRRASKGRKIRYNVLEPLVNFMAPEPMELPLMTSKLFFGRRETPVS